MSVDPTNPPVGHALVVRKGGGWFWLACECDDAGEPVYQGTDTVGDVIANYSAHLKTQRDKLNARWAEADAVAEQRKAGDAARRHQETP